MNTFICAIFIQRSGLIKSKQRQQVALRLFRDSLKVFWLERSLQTLIPDILTFTPHHHVSFIGLHKLTARFLERNLIR